MSRKIVLYLTFVFFFTSLALAQDFEWVRQFGNFEADSARALAADSSGIYVVGVTQGTFLGQISAGGSDAFIRKYDIDGKEIWTRQFGNVEANYAQDVAVDPSGIYVLGATYGTFAGQLPAGELEVFVRKYDADGNVLWTRLFGTPATDYAKAISADPSGIYVVGSTHGTFPGQISAGGSDVFIRKYDADGKEIWTKQFGNPGNDLVKAAAVDPTGIYVAGVTHDTFPGQISAGGSDAFVKKYDADGKNIWTRQFGTADTDYVEAVAADSYGIYVLGVTHGTFPGHISAGGSDVFIRKYDANGREFWTRQFGTPKTDYAFDISPGIYVVGSTQGAFFGQFAEGASDIFIRKYNAYGNAIRTRQFGNQNWDSANAVLTHSSGIYLAGQTYGPFQGQMPIGGSDAFIIKIKKEENRFPDIHDQASLKPERANQPPVIQSVSDQTWHFGFTKSSKLSVKDPDGDPLTYSTTGLLPGVTLNPDGLISGSPTQTGSFPVTVTVSDTQGESVNVSFTIVVKVTVEGLIREVKKLNLATEINRSLLSPLEAAREARGRHNIKAFKNSLEDFINRVKEAQDALYIFPLDAEKLIQLARIRLKENFGASVKELP